MTDFSDVLWKKTQSIYHATIYHPFNQELVQGSLPIEKFQFYLKQDVLYLEDFAKALAITGAKLQKQTMFESFLNFSKGALVAETELHKDYFQHFGIQLDIEISYACFSYTNFLLAYAYHRSPEESVAALLPCFWVYREVGKNLYRQFQEKFIEISNHPYQKWITTYSSEEFSLTVDQAISYLNELAKTASPTQLEQMKKAFVYSCRLEWLFWESAYSMNSWQPK